MQQGSEIKVGIFVVVVIALAVVIASNLKGGLAGRSRTYEFEIWFENAPGVGKGNPIQLAGVEVGQVLQKDILEITEVIRYERRDDGTWERQRLWADIGEPDGRPAEIVIDRVRVARPASPREVSRPRSVARLLVRVDQDQELYTGYQYEITGGIVFGDRQLTVSQIGSDGLPLDDEERGTPINAATSGGQRVAVLGGAPPSIDRIVSTAQNALDEETAENFKQILRNIEMTTGRAAEMVGAMHDVVGDNRANIDELVGNLAAMSTELQTGLTEARGMASQTLSRFERTAAVGQRLAEGNETRLNRITGNIEATTGSLSRIATSSEGQVTQTLADVSALTRDLRATVGGSRGNLEATAGNIAQATADVAALTADSREQVTTILRSVDQTLERVARIMADSEANLTRITADLAAVTSRSRETVEGVQDEIGPLAESVRQAAENLNTASRNLASLSADPALSQSLANIERATSEATAMVSDLRELTADPDLKDDLRTSARNVRQLSDTVSGFFGDTGGVDPRFWSDLYLVSDSGRFQTDLRLDVEFERMAQTLHFGLDRLTEDPVWSGQLGSYLFDRRARLRYGFFRGKLGGGFDYLPGNDRWWVRSDFYDPADPHLNLRGYYRLGGLTGLVGVDDAFGGSDFLIGVQLGSPLR